MPALHLHLLADFILITSICLLDKKIKKDKKSTYYLILAVIGANIIDIDHLLATPIYDPNRCGINLHPLHSWYTMPLWIIGLLSKNKYAKYFCLSVLMHLWLDWIDCVFLM